jgi:DNA repair exonuclease SbcCD ATPase subunit
MDDSIKHFEFVLKNLNTRIDTIASSSELSTRETTAALQNLSSEVSRATASHATHTNKTTTNLSSIVKRQKKLKKRFLKSERMTHAQIAVISDHLRTCQNSIKTVFDTLRSMKFDSDNQWSVMNSRISDVEQGVGLLNQSLSSCYGLVMDSVSLNARPM